MRYWLLGVLAATSCDYVFRLDRIPLPDSGPIDSTLGSGSADARPVDAHLTDAPSSDAPLDAFACVTHAECAAMTSGDCCVNPGPIGYCTHGVIIGGVCSPQ
jgi:hypothetical protein